LFRLGCALIGAIVGGLFGVWFRSIGFGYWSRGAVFSWGGWPAGVSGVLATKTTRTKAFASEGDPSKM